MSRRIFTPLASILIVLIFLGGNALVQRGLTGARLDLTERGLYTLSAVTREAVARLSETVEITMVYSRRVGAEYPAVRAHAARVREMLNAYASASGGRVRVREIDPLPFSPAEDEALAAGISAIATQGPDPLYFGIIGRNLADDEAILPYLAPEQETTLEYDLTRLIVGLDQPDPPRIGVLTTLPGLEGDGRERGYRVLQNLARSYRIVPVPADFITLPERLDALLIAHPPPLDRRQSYVLDQYFMQGGRALIFLDPVSKASQAAISLVDPAPRETASDMPELLEWLGIALSEHIAGDADLGLPVRLDLGEGRSAVVSQPLYLGVPAALMDPTSPVTGELTRAVNLGAAGFFTIRPETGIRSRILMSTSPAAAALDPALALEDSPPAKVLESYIKGEAKLDIAVSLGGEKRSRFAAGPVAPDIPDDPVLADLVRAEMEAAPEHLAAPVEPFALILVADTDMLDDGFYIDPASGLALADNGAFVENALEALTGRIGLNRLRARAPALRPMSLVEDMRNAAQAEFFGQQASIEAELSGAQARLEELQARGAGSDFLQSTGADALDPQERAELSTLRTQILSARERLRAIERDYRREIDRLEGSLKLLNIWLMPGLVLLTGVGLTLWRRRRSR